MRPALPLQPPLKHGSLHLTLASSRRPPYFFMARCLNISTEKRQKKDTFNSVLNI